MQQQGNLLTVEHGVGRREAATAAPTGQDVDGLAPVGAPRVARLSYPAVCVDTADGVPQLVSLKRALRLGTAIFGFFFWLACNGAAGLRLESRSPGERHKGNMDKEKIIEFLIAYTKGVDLMHCAGFAIANSFQEPEDYSNYGCAISFLSRESCSVQSSEELQKWHVLHHKGYVAEHVGEPGGFSHAFPPPFNFIGPGDVDLELVSDQLVEAEVSTDNGTYKFRIAPSQSHPFGLMIDTGELTLKWGAGTVNVFE